MSLGMPTGTCCLGSVKTVQPSTVLARKICFRLLKPDKKLSPTHVTPWATHLERQERKRETRAMYRISLVKAVVLCLLRQAVVFLLGCCMALDFWQWRA